MRMFIEPVDQITFANIQTFVQEGYRTGLVLDYRAAWPRDLAKIMAAMANTQGGMILVGVEEDPDSEGPPAVSGIELDDGAEGLRQRAITIAHKEIYPPIIPEVTVCPLDTDPNRGIFVIRIAPSDYVPHAINNQRHVYVRVNSVERPNRLATLRDLEFLWARRQHAEEWRETLLQAAGERADWFLSGASKPNPTPRLQAWVMPYFCASKQVLSLQQTAELVRTHRPRSDILRGRWSFPNYAHRTRSVPTGYCAYDSDDQYPQYVELSASGLVFTELRLHDEHEQTGWQRVHFPFVLSQIDGLVKFAAHAYQHEEVGALLQVHAELQNVQGALLFAVPNALVTEPERNRGPNATLEVLHETVVSVELEEGRTTFIQETARRMLWGFGYTSGSDEEFERWYQAQVLGHR